MTDHAIYGIEALLNLTQTHRVDARVDNLWRHTFRLEGEDVVSQHTRTVYGAGLRTHSEEVAQLITAEGCFSWKDMINEVRERSVTKNTTAQESGSAHLRQNLDTDPFSDENLKRFCKRLHAAVEDAGSFHCIAKQTHGYRFVVSEDGTLHTRDRTLITLYAHCEVSSEVEETKVKVPLLVGGRETASVIQQGRQKIEDWVRRIEMCRESEEAPTTECPVVLSPAMSAFLIHEAFGHLCEADRIPKKNREAFSLGRRVAADPVHVRDVPGTSNWCGGMTVDDEGTECIPTPLIEEGRWTGLLHTRETANSFEKVPTGNARTTSFRYAPISRMRTTILNSGPDEPEDLIEKVDRGIYLDFPCGGQLRGATIRVFASHGRRIENGRLAQPVGRTVLEAQPLRVFRHIKGLGNDRRIFSWLGNCDRGEQTGLPVSMGAPTLLLSRVKITEA